MPFCLYNKKNIARRLKDMNFIFEWQNNILPTSAAPFTPAIKAKWFGILLAFI